MAGGWRRLHNEELHNLYASPKIIRVIKSRRMRWAGHVARMGDMTNAFKIWLENHSGDPGIDGRMIIECILEK
jgi:hypothetical protein